MKVLFCLFFSFAALALFAQNELDTKLFEAVKNGNIRYANVLLSKGANINAHDNNGSTPLMYSAYKQMPGMFKFLINSGAAYMDNSRITDSISYQYDLMLAADSLQKTGRFDLSLKYGLLQWDVTKKIYGENTRFSAVSANILGISYLGLDSVKKAQRFFRIAEAVYRDEVNITDVNQAIILQNLGLTEKSLGQYGNAADHLRKSILWFEQHGYTDDDEHTDRLAFLAEALVQSSNFDEAKEVCTKGLRLLGAKGQPVRNLNYVRFMNVLGTANTLAGTKDAVRDQLEDAYKTCISMPGCNGQMQADILFNFGLYESLCEHFSDANSLFYNVKQLAESNRMTGSLLYGICLFKIAENLSRTGDKDSLDIALAFARRSRDMFKEREYDDPVSYVTSSIILGKIYIELELYDSALICFDRPVAIAEQMKLKDRLLYCKGLQHRAEVFRLMGENDTAIQLNEKVLEILKSTGNTQGLDIAVSIHNLAILYTIREDFEKSIKYNEEANNFFATVNNGRSELYLSGLNNQAENYIILGQLGKALTIFKKAFDVFEAMPDKSEKYRYYLYNNLAQLYSYTGQLNEADSLLQSLLPVIGRQKGLNYRDAVFYMNLGVTSMNLKKYDLANQYFKTAAMQFAGPAKAQGNMEGLLYCNWADLMHRMDSLESCFAYFDKGFGILQKSTLTKTPVYYEVLLSYSLALLTKGDYHTASDVLKEAVVFYRNYLNYASSFTGSSGITDYYDKAGILHGLLFSLSLKPEMGSLISDCLDLQLALKGLVLRNRVDLNRIVRNTHDTLVAKTFGELRMIKEQLAKMYERKEPVSVIDSLQERFSYVEEKLIDISPEFQRAVSDRKVDWRTIQHSLGEHEVAIDFSHFNFLNFQEKKKESPIIYVAYVIRHTGQPVVVQLCHSVELEQRINDTADRKLSFVTRLYGRQAEAGGVSTNAPTLYKLVWEPLASYLNDTDTVYYSLTGLLHRVNFAAITTPSGEVLSDVYKLHLMGSLRDVVTYSSPAITREDDKLLVYGGINYNMDSTALRTQRAAYDPRNITGDGQLSFLRGENFPELGELKYSALEAAEIEKISIEQHYPCEVRTGINASEESFRFFVNQQRSPAVIHISTHGFFIPDRKAESKLKKDAPYYLSAGNAFLRSGIYFAGANQVVTGMPRIEGIEDGVVTAYDMTNFNLQNTKLTVLSSCVSGLGKIDNTEGVFGLQRAVHMAGCNNLVMSLWEVNDEAASEFMKFFYQGLLAMNNKTIYESFQFAQKEMKRTHPGDPYRWASFILME